MNLGARKRVLAVAAQMQDPVSLAALQAAGSVETLLGLLQLSQYAPWFREQDVDKDVFISLLESDLVEMQVGGSACMIDHLCSIHAVSIGY